MEQFAIDFRQLGEDSGSLIFAFDAEYRFLYVNPQAERLAGVSREHLLGRTIWEAAPYLEGAVYHDNFRRAMQERAVVEFEAHSPGLERWDHVRCVPELGGGLIVFARDITHEHYAQAAREAALSLLSYDIAERERAEGRLRRLFDSQVVGVIFWNLDTSLITDANDTFLAMVGYTRDDLAAGLLDFRKMTPAEWTDRNEQGVAAIRAEGSAATYEKEYFRKDGSRVPILIGGTRFEESGAEGFSYVLDITERKRREEQERARLQAIFMQAPAFMATLRGPQHVFEMANPPYYQLVGRSDILGKPVTVALPEVVDQGFVQILDQVYQTGKPFIGKDMRLLLRVTPHGPLDERFLDFAYQPLYDKEKQVSGILVHGIDLTERKRLEIEQERLLGEARARAEREALLNRVGEAIRATTDPEEIQQVAVRALGEALKADRCYFSFNDLAADSHWVGQDFHRSDLPSLAGHYRISEFQVNPEDFYPNERTLIIPDAMEDRWSLPEVLLSALRKLRLRSAISVRIFEGERRVATLSVAMADKPRDWTDDEVRLVEAVAAQTRSAVETARLLAAQQARLKEEALIGRIGVAIRSELDPDAIQEEAAALVGEALNVSRCFYLTYDASRDAAHAGRDYHRGDLASLAGDYRLSDFAEMLTELFASGGTAVIVDVHASLSPAIAQGMLSSQNRALLAVPFFDGGQLVAALWASMDEPRIWTAHEIALIEQAATLTRTALETARVSVKERAIVQQLQEALQPTVPKHIPGLSLGSFTQPALDEASVGGDFMDVFVLDKEQYAIVMGDVSGKGLAAAQQLALIRNTLRTTLYLYRAPAQAAAALNAIVTAHDLLVGFVTAWIGVYDAATGEIRFCSCGHEPALIRKANGDVEALRTASPPLGVADNAEYRDRAFMLASGDALLLYTDGISESGPSRRDLLGTDGLMGLLTKTQVDANVQHQAETIVADASAYANGAFRDDVAVLLARRQ
ncbi:hypothetical protein CCAX7_16330 [Capsulimonas corticalis]|uniref:Uncharacterized protein n=1 Tax=Capsulimonas corticalis TaxID=2219043 RepID=A0A402CYY9_9BACT|nr:SpoIIE family protein phosphatase [Capsulimonas corticalis]BDI29582.1 hypothetical protein CCAX7_16330 [Capsulimonas corticalis]